MEEVNCQIAEGPIPVSLCYQEQGTSACAGCKTLSRKCPECGRAGNMGEAKEGVCQDCLRKLKSKAGDSRPSLPGGNTSAALEIVLDDLGDVGEGNLSALRGGEEDASAPSELDTSVFKMSPRAQDVGFILGTLGEFIVQKHDGSRIVTAAQAVLIAQARLMPHEAEHAIDLLVTRGLAQRQGERDLLILATEIPRFAVEPTLREALNTRAHAPLRITGRPNDPKSRNVPTMEEIYSILQSRHRVVGEERLVSGGVPILQLLLQIGSPVAIRMLESLQEEGLIKAKDGWRTLVLLGEGEVQDSRPALREETILRMERSAARARLVIRKGVLNTFAFTRALEFLDGAIGELEAIQTRVGGQLTALLVHREEVHQAKLAYEDALKESENAVRTTDTIAAAVKPPHA